MVQTITLCLHLSCHCLVTTMPIRTHLLAMLTSQETLRLTSTTTPLTLNNARTKTTRPLTLMWLTLSIILVTVNRLTSLKLTILITTRCNSLWTSILSTRMKLTDPILPSTMLVTPLDRMKVMMTVAHLTTTSTTQSEAVNNRISLMTKKMIAQPWVTTIPTSVFARL